MNEKKDGVDADNVIKVPPRRRLISYKGMHGWIEYRPVHKVWDWILKLQFTLTHRGTEKSEAEAELKLKQYIDAFKNSKNIRSVD